MTIHLYLVLQNDMEIKIHYLNHLNSISKRYGMSNVAIFNLVHLYCITSFVLYNFHFFFVYNFSFLFVLCNFHLYYIIFCLYNKLNKLYIQNQDNLLWTMTHSNIVFIQNGPTTKPMEIDICCFSFFKKHNRLNAKIERSVCFSLLKSCLLKLL